MTANHPVDRLAMVREQIRTLEEEERVLRAAVVDLDEPDRVGFHFAAKVSTGHREAWDAKGLVEAVRVLGGDPSPYRRSSEVVTVRLTEVGDV